MKLQWNSTLITKGLHVTCLFSFSTSGPLTVAKRWESNSNCQRNWRIISCAIFTAKSRWDRVSLKLQERIQDFDPVSRPGPKKPDVQPLERGLRTPVVSQNTAKRIFSCLLTVVSGIVGFGPPRAPWRPPLQWSYNAISLCYLCWNQAGLFHGKGTERCGAKTSSRFSCTSIKNCFPSAEWFHFWGWSRVLTVRIKYQDAKRAILACLSLLAVVNNRFAPFICWVSLEAWRWGGLNHPKPQLLL